MSGGGDARSPAASAARARFSSSSFLPAADHPSAFDKHPFSRYDRTDRDNRHAHSRPGKTDWSSDRPYFHRSSSSTAPFFHSASFSGPPTKRRALGRYGGGAENGRYGSTVGQSWDTGTAFAGAFVQNGKAERDLGRPSPRYSRYSGAVGRTTGGTPSWSMVSAAENGKGERDLSWSSPRYSKSPIRDKSSKEQVDSHYHREFSNSPVDRRPSSSPRLDMVSIGHGEYTDHEERSRVREWSKHSGSSRWSSAYRGQDCRERVWSKPEHYRRSLPKLDATRDWSFGDRELEKRIDRYGSLAVREHGFSDVAKASKDWFEDDLEIRDRRLHSQDAMHVSSNLFSNDMRAQSPPMEVSEYSSPQSHTMQMSCSPDSRRDVVGQMSPRKKPRLTWGQGLAKYEKSKGEEPGSANRNDGDNFDRSYVDGSVESQYEPPQAGCAVSFSGNSGPHCGHETVSGIQGFSCVSPCEKLLGDSDGLMYACISATPLSSPASILPEVQAFLSSYQRDLSLSKHVLMRQVEKLELEIELAEKDIVKLKDADLSLMDAQYPSNTDVAAVQALGVDEVCPPSPDCGVRTPFEVPLPDDSSNVGCARKDTRDDHRLPEIAEKVDFWKGENVADSNCVEHAHSVNVSVTPDIGSSCRNDQLKESAKNSLSSIFMLNQEVANRSATSLSHLMLGYSAHGKLYDRPEDASVWKHNTESHERRKGYLEAKVAETRNDMKFTERVLSAKYLVLKDNWKHDGEIGKDGVFAMEQRVGVSSKSYCNVVQERGLFLQCDDYGPSHAALKDIEVGRKLEIVSLRMPAMTLGGKGRVAALVNNNALVEDPVAVEKERKYTNPWLEEEISIFLDKFTLFGKQFSKVASFLEHKTVADCVEFYYRNQKAEEFERIHRKHKMKKRRDCLRSTASYLATTTSVSSKYRHADAACAEGLSLVAAAAAAMSVPKKFDRVVPNAGLCSTNKSGFKSFTLDKGKNLIEDQAFVVGVKNVQSDLFDEERDSSWTDSERELFISAVAVFGKNFKRISLHVGSKSQRQCKAFFTKVRKRLGLDHLIEHSNATGDKHMGNANGFTEDLNKSGPTKEAVDTELNAEQLSVKVEEVGRSEDMSSRLEEKRFEVAPPLDGMATAQQPEVICPAKVLQAGKKNQNIGVACIEMCKPMQSSFNDAAMEEASLTGNMDTACGISDDHSSLDVGQSQSELGSWNCGDGLPSEKVELANADAVSKDLPLLHDTQNLVPAGMSPVPVVANSQIGKEKVPKSLETKTRREPTSWTPDEKEKFIEIIKNFGKDWERLREGLPSKSLTQIKTFFQNSKAKLGLACEGVGGRGGSRKRKVEEGTSGKAGILGSPEPQKMPAHVDDGSLKFNPITSTGVVGNSSLASEGLAYATLFGRNPSQDSISAFHSMGLMPNAATMGILPMFNSSIFSPPNIVSAQQSHAFPPLNVHQAHSSVVPTVNTQPLTSGPVIQQAHQQLSMTGAHQEPTVSVAQNFLNQTSQQHPSNVSNFFQQQQQQQQHVIRQLQQFQQQQQSGFLQSHFFQMLARPQGFTQQLQHNVPIQLQLQRQQQLQKQIPGSPQLAQPNINFQEQQPHSALSFEQQQHQIVAFRELIRTAAMVSEVSKLGMADSQASPSLQQQVVPDGLQQPLAPCQASHALPKSDALVGAADVKLFGQPLVPQPISYSDDMVGKVLSHSIPLTPPSGAACPLAHIPDDHQLVGPKSAVCLPTEPPDIISRNPNGSDDTLVLSKSKLPEGAGGGQMVTSQGLPRVVDALVALAQWRLQNSSRSIDDFLAQSWNALCRDPGLSLETGKAAAGSFPQIIPGMSEMLMYSQPHVMHLLASMGGAAWNSSNAARSPVTLSQAASSNGVHNAAQPNQQQVVESSALDSNDGATT